MQGASKIHCITSGMRSSYADNKNGLYQQRSENVHFPAFLGLSITLRSLHYLTLKVPYVHLLHEYRLQLHPSLLPEVDPKSLA
jgi:hypothetical protein